MSEKTRQLTLALHDGVYLDIAGVTYAAPSVEELIILLEDLDVIK